MPLLALALVERQATEGDWPLGVCDGQITMDPESNRTSSSSTICGQDAMRRAVFIHTPLLSSSIVICYAVRRWHAEVDVEMKSTGRRSWYSVC